MKKRNGFVSNSSSSSFIIIKDYLSNYQIEQIMNHINIAKSIDNDIVGNGGELKYEYYEDWTIKVDEFALFAGTTMDNFDMIEFLVDEIGVDHDHIIHWGDFWGNEDIADDSKYQKLKREHRLKKVNLFKNKSRNNG